ncbi:hypothetical protein [Rhizobacter fulvus]
MDLLGLASEIRLRLAWCLSRHKRLRDAAVHLRPVFDRHGQSDDVTPVLLAGTRTLRDLSETDWGQAITVEIVTVPMLSQCVSSHCETDFDRLRKAEPRGLMPVNFAMEECLANEAANGSRGHHMLSAGRANRALPALLGEGPRAGSSHDGRLESL